jgi:hypothetical protein
MRAKDKNSQLAITYMVKTMHKWRKIIARSGFEDM